MFSILFAEFLQKIKTHHDDVCSHNKRKDKQMHTPPPHTTLTPKAPFPALVITPLPHWLASIAHNRLPFYWLNGFFFRLSFLSLYFSSTRN